MNGYEIIEDVAKLFKVEDGRWSYYTRYTELATEEDEDDLRECSIEDVIIGRFIDSPNVAQYTYSTEHFDGGPGYEATVIFFAWVDEDGDLCSDQILTECM